MTNDIASEKAAFEHGYLKGLLHRTQWYQRLRRITNVSLPVRERRLETRVSQWLGFFFCFLSDHILWTSLEFSAYFVAIE
jgi:hypothetical protein